jgi:O-antigen ligase
VFFNKGIAYSYAAEVLLVLGVIMLLYNFKKIEIPLDKKLILLLVFLFLGIAYIFRGIGKYGFIDLIRDSFIFNYALFVFILIFLRKDITYLLNGIYKIYAWFPLVATVSFLILSYVPRADELKIFGSISLFHYKYGDMAVQLLIATLFLLNGKIKLAPRFLVANAIMIAYLLLIASSFSRAGMICFVIAFLLFFFFSKDQILKNHLLAYLRYLPIVLLVALPIYLITNVKENFQGRKVGISQLSENVTSIISTEKGSTQSNNNVWRLVWWGKIIDYTFGGEYFLQGKGLGMSLADDDNIEMDEENDLRSPHNFHLNILARFGVPVFFLWLYWLFLHFKLFRKKDLTPDSLLFLSIICVFLLNASFDVFLEGPMGAFPFWTMVGLFYISEIFHPKSELKTAT